MSRRKREFRITFSYYRISQLNQSLDLVGKRIMFLLNTAIQFRTQVCLVGLSRTTCFYKCVWSKRCLLVKKQNESQSHNPENGCTQTRARCQDNLLPTRKPTYERLVHWRPELRLRAQVMEGKVRSTTDMHLLLFQQAQWGPERGKRLSHS